MKVFEYATKEAWAILARTREDGEIESPDLEMILNIAQRAHEPDFDAVIKAQARHLEAREAAAKPLNGVAQMNVIGPIFRYANVFTQLSGGASVSSLQSDLEAAMEDPSVRAILLNLDTPGGQVEGVSDLADAIRAAAAQKPVVAFSDGAMASAGYWIGSAAKRMVVSDTAILGSLGVVATVRQKEKEKGHFEFVSSVSPRKRSDVSSDEGRSQVQAIVDSTAAVFLGKVAQYRGVDLEKVKADFGAGGLLVGAEAVAAGMADAVGTRNSVLASLIPRERMYSFGALSAANIPTKRSSSGMPDVEFTAEQLTAVNHQIETARVETRKVERARISAILTSPEAEGRETLARTMALETDLGPEAAAQLLKAAEKKSPAVVEVKGEFERHMERLTNPQVGVGEVEQPKPAVGSQAWIDAEAESILTAGGRKK